MTTFLLILYAALVSSLVVLNIYASLRCWRDELSSHHWRPLRRGPARPADAPSGGMAFAQSLL